jgi:hypothetical protein
MRTSGMVGRKWIYWTNRYGSYVRDYPDGPKPPDPPHNVPGMWPGNLTAIWHAMSAPAQRAWTPYAKLYQLPTYQAFMKCNITRTANGLPPVTVPP